MAQPPAFQFYPADFIVGTLALSNACVGAYIRLLCHQWASGGIPNDLDDMARIVRETRSKMDRIWIQIRSKFETGPDGRWRNPRLEDVRRKQQAFSELQARKGRAGGRATQANRQAGAAFRLKPNSSSSSSSSSVRTYKNATTSRAHTPQPVEKSPKVPTLAALLRTELLPRVNGHTDEGDIVEAAKRLAAEHHLDYTTASVVRALASARAQVAKRGYA